MFRFVATALLVLLAAAPAAAQSGGIRVRVLDVDEQPLAGATVHLTNDQGLVPPTSELADAKGMVEFPVLRTGLGYAVEVAMPGFSASRQSGVRVRSNSTRQLVFHLNNLTDSGLEERVEVVSARSIVDVNQVGTSTKFSGVFIDGLPTPGRFYQEVLTLAPGVNDEDGDGNPNVHGARTRDFRVEVSGVSNVDPLTGQWLSRVNPDSIEEMELLPVGAGVEFGRAQGGFARVVQKQGTNEFEGVFNFLYRGSKLDGDGAGNSNGIGGTPEFNTYEPSIQLSGPLVKDKLWFRLSHEYVSREDPVNLLNRIDVTTRTQTINSDQLTWQVSPRNKLALQYQSDPLTLENLGISTTVPGESSRQLETDGPTWSLSWVAPYSPRLLVDTLVAYQDISQDIVPTTNGIANDCMIFDFFTPLNNSRCTNLSTTRVTGSHFESSRDKRQRLTVRSQFTLYRRLWGQSHQIKLGFRVENERYFRDLVRGPDVTFETDEDPLGNVRGLTSARVSIPQTSNASATGNSWAVFLEDQWKPSSHLAVTLGVRVDREEIDSLGSEVFDPQLQADEFERRVENGATPAQTFKEVFTAYEDIQGFQAELAAIMSIPPPSVRVDSVTAQSAFWRRSRRAENIRIRNTNFSPRLSIAWDPWSDGKTKIAATAGRYYDKIFLAVPLVELEPIETTINFIEPLRSGEFTNFDTTLATSPLTAKVVDRELSTPYQDEFTLTFEREVAVEMSVRATYVRRRFRDQLQDIDINHSSGDYGSCVLPLPQDGRVVTSSIGSGQVVTDPYTGEQYIDTDPGFGDGRIDDCTGDVRQIGGTLGFQTSVPDGREDLYALNPGWREILLLGNFNESEYRSIVLELIRRQYRNWELQASYTWSRAEGDAEDFDLLLGNEQNLRDDEEGFLDFDQRHVVRLNVTSFIPYGFRVGTTIRWESGLPYSQLITPLTVFSTPPLYFNQGPRELRPRFRFPTGQRNDQRNGAFWTFDALVAKEFRVAGDVQVQIRAEVFNLLNDDTLRLEEQVDGVNTGARRFGRQWQLGLRMNF